MRCDEHTTLHPQRRRLLTMSTPIAQLGGLTLGLSVGGAVFVNVASEGLYRILPSTPRDQVQQMVSGTSGDLIKSLSSDMRHRVLEVIVSAWNDVYVSCPSFPRWKRLLLTIV